MAHIEHWVCFKCKEAQNSVRSSDCICYTCHKKKADAARKKHFDALRLFTIGERLHKVEVWQYEHSHDELQERMYLDG